MDSITSTGNDIDGFGVWEGTRRNRGENICNLFLK